MERPPRFASLRLSYGRHSSRFEFPDAPAPFVILGPNGAGKTTLLEGLVRTLFGFNRRLEDDRRRASERRPWAAEPYRGAVEIEHARGLLSIERDFATDQVIVRLARERKPLFEGEANLAGGRRARDAYRDLLGTWLGLDELEVYEATACVGQGDLSRTRLDDELLKIGAGGLADVRSARARLRADYAAQTLEPIEAGDTRRRKPGAVEAAAAELAELERRCEAASAAAARRRPLIAERMAVEAKAAEIRARIRRLEALRDRVALREAIEAKRGSCVRRLDRLEALIEDVRLGIASVRIWSKRPEDPYDRYPDDFAERAAALNELWRLERRLEERIEAEERSARRGWRWGAGPGRGRQFAQRLVGAALVLLGAFLAVSVHMALGLITLASGLAVVAHSLRGAPGGRVRAGPEEGGTRVELEEVRQRIRERRAGVPDSATLSPATLPDRERRFRERRAEREERARGLAALERVVGEASRVLEQRTEGAREAATPQGSAASDAVPTEAPSSDGATSDAEAWLRRAERLSAELTAAIGRERARLAALDLELREQLAPDPELARDEPLDSTDVQRSLEDLRCEADRLEERLRAILEKLAAEGQPRESPASLEERVERARARLNERKARAAAYRHAYHLVADAYEEFRRTDQERLLRAVSERLRETTAGALGPVAADGGLETASVRFRSRALPLDSPPLSYGQLHSVFFAIRLGAVDFLAGLGVGVPLLVDDPFVHLDERSSAGLWEVLRRIAEQRQVIVATQDRLLLEHLAVEPDLVLSESRGRREPPASLFDSSAVR